MAFYVLYVLCFFVISFGSFVHTCFGLYVFLLCFFVHICFEFYENLRCFFGVYFLNKACYTLNVFEKALFILLPHVVAVSPIIFDMDLEDYVLGIGKKYTCLATV